MEDEMEYFEEALKADVYNEVGQLSGPHGKATEELCDVMKDTLGMSDHPTVWYEGYREAMKLMNSLLIGARKENNNEQLIGAAHRTTVITSIVAAKVIFDHVEAEAQIDGFGTLVEFRNMLDSIEEENIHKCGFCKSGLEENEGLCCQKCLDEFVGYIERDREAMVARRKEKKDVNKKG